MRLKVGTHPNEFESNLLMTGVVHNEQSKRTPPLAVQIADRLERDIIAGFYRPGERLREQEIADRAGVSRGPVREAFRIVEKDGLITNEPWKGLRVVELDANELSDLMDVVAALQGLLARLAARHATKRNLDQIGDLIVRMDKSLAAGAPMREQLQLAFECGAILREACGSKRASTMMTRVGRLAYWQHRFLLNAPNAWRAEAIGHWRQLHKALIEQNPGRADASAHEMVHHSKLQILLSYGSDEETKLEPLPDHMLKFPE